MLSLSKFSIKNLVKEHFDQENLVKVMCCHYQIFLMIGQRKGGNSVSTKSKMAPVNISQNDYLALSLCLLCMYMYYHFEEAN